MTEEEYREKSLALQRIASFDALTVADMAVWLDVGVPHILRMTSLKKIPYYRGMNGKNYFSKKEIEKWMLARRVATDEETAAEAATRCTIGRR